MEDITVVRAGDEPQHIIITRPRMVGAVLDIAEIDWRNQTIRVNGTECSADTRVGDGDVVIVTPAGTEPRAITGPEASPIVDAMRTRWERRLARDELERALGRIFMGYAMRFYPDGRAELVQSRRGPETAILTSEEELTRCMDIAKDMLQACIDGSTQIVQRALDLEPHLIVMLFGRTGKYLAAKYRNRNIYLLFDMVLYAEEFTHGCRGADLEYEGQEDKLGRAKERIKRGFDLAREADVVQIFDFVRGPRPDRWNTGIIPEIPGTATRHRS